MIQLSGISNTPFTVNNNWLGDEKNFAALLISDQAKVGHTYDISCQWEALCDQIMRQWPLLTKKEVSNAGPNRKYIATLISEKYALNYRIIKNYLFNLERNLPLM